jgi:carbamate kinase
MTMENQQDNISSCMASLNVVRDYKNYVGSKRTSKSACWFSMPHTKKKLVWKPMHLDVDAETEGMIGYLIEQGCKPTLDQSEVWRQYLRFW